MAILVRTCCCGCSLKTGILIIAVLGVLSGGYGIYSNLAKLKNLEDEMRELGKEGTLPIPYEDYNVVISLGYTNVVLNGLVIFTCILLMISYGKENRFLALPYLVLHILLLAYTLGVTVFFISTWNGFAYQFIFLGFIIISWLLSIYFIVIVYSYYKSLQDQSEPAADYCPPMPMVQVPGGPPQYPKYP